MTLPTKTIVITGSHHTPAIELIKQLRTDNKYHWQIEYIAHLFPHDTHIRHTIIDKLNVSFHHLESGKYDRRWLPYTIKGIPLIFKAIIKSNQLIKTIKPDIVVSFGGYISVPVIVAAWLNRCPSITHEQTIHQGLATKINSLFVNKVALSFPRQKLNAKEVLTGNLIRTDIYSKNSLVFKHLAPKLAAKPLIYITGGSQGSHIINENVKSILPELIKHYTVIHSIGVKDITSTNSVNSYYPVEYINLDDIGWVFNNASVVVSRSGANTCQEIAALKLRSILIPLLVSQHDEQNNNAIWLKKQLPKSTLIILEKDLTPKSLLKAINFLARKPKKTVPVNYQPNFQILRLIHGLIQ